MKRGFSLVELSVVLVILGLLIGGIMAGRSLIRASELRRVTTDLTRYTTAMHTFRAKYNCLPGDLDNATSIWPSAAHNGNCNGLLHSYTEHVGAWQHLALAGLIEGSYDGVWDVDGYTPAGSNAPIGSLSNSSVVAQADISSAGGFAVFQRTENHFKVGATAIHVTYGTSNYLTTAEDAYYIDAKIDDGKAQYGRFLAGGSSNCVSNSVANAPNPAVDYNLSNSNIACVLFYFF